MFLRSLITVWREIIVNFHRVTRLARYEQKAKTNNTTLGVMWNVLSPMLQIFVYWFVFGIGLKVVDPKGDYPYVVWMMSGILPWFFINGTMQSGMTSIERDAPLIKNIAIPLSIIPIKTVTTGFVEHLWTIAVLIPILLILGVTPSPYMLQTLYYMFAAFMFLSAFTLLSSAITAMFQDLPMIINPLIRLLFYISGVVWSLDNLPANAQAILRINPITYIVEGYRYSLLDKKGFWTEPQSAIIFWIVTGILMITGCGLHMRLRKRFVDMI